MGYRFGAYRLDEQRFELLRGGQPVALRPMVFDLLLHLVRHHDRVVPREELVRALWGETRVGAGSLSGLVNELRRGLGERGVEGSVVRTVHARGYRFVGHVESSDGAGAAGDAGWEGAQGTTSGPPRPALPPEVADRWRRFRESLERWAAAEGAGGRAITRGLDELLERRLAELGLFVTSTGSARPAEPAHDERWAAPEASRRRVMRTVRPGRQSDGASVQSGPRDVQVPSGEPRA